MISRITNSLRSIGNKYKNNKNGIAYLQSDQEMADTFKTFIATETFKSVYYNNEGDFKKFLDNSDNINGILNEAENTKYMKQKESISQVLNTQLLEMYELMHSYGGKNSYPPPLKDLPYYSMEEKLKRCLSIKETDNRGEPIEHPRGFKIHVKSSTVDHEEAGYGVYIEGEVIPGTVVALYPGDTYDGENIPPSIVRENEYMMSRYDGTIIDGRSWNKKCDELTLKSKMFKEIGTNVKPTDILCYRNPFAIGNFINHPPADDQPNVIAYAFNYRRGFPDHLVHYIPNRTITENQYFSDNSVIRRGVVLIAFKPIINSELFLNYRFNPDLPYPDWYTQPDLEEAKRRWGERRSISIHSVLNKFK
ncbi:hypothetical protein DICPUDRAFT_81815 [Dictyostelium purpureum]|uniref:SET domain-containing protein n=1 Tax=Dictyostelium purpureum TaxID=5786 RepID=F0ZUN8_DICPU|nr:uncharacterized protein DICPUDRAFT_81815 [Dictyostelium purpureum]EGC32328.1 hypothetical protein DICPUDRAFT_81815 [Dictyostelium purpureum]|eukprot:XP_003291130.1 hypothetical protein DICPUDRAFT_81815 [Dictyostelium purpureum]